MTTRREARQIYSLVRCFRWKSDVASKACCPDHSCSQPERNARRFREHLRWLQKLLIADALLAQTWLLLLNWWMTEETKLWNSEHRVDTRIHMKGCLRRLTADAVPAPD